MLGAALALNATLPNPIKTLDLSMNQIAGIDKLGQGQWSVDHCIIP